MRENLPNNETNSSLDSLRKRYEKRSEDYHASDEYIEQDSREVFTRTLAPEAYRHADDLEEYKSIKNGSDGYMTGKDFASYYSEQRKYTPEPNVNFDTAVALKAIDQKRYGQRSEENIKDMMSEGKRKDALRQTLEQNSSEQKTTDAENGYIIREKKNNNLPRGEQRSRSPLAEKAQRLRSEWLPIEERNKEKLIEGKKTKLPKMMIFAIITIAFSLLLIVGSTVMLTMAQKEQATLEGELSGLRTEEKLLSEELERKNSKLGIEEFAENELGMISRDYVSVKYIKQEKGDSLETGDSEKSEEVGIFWIFEAITSLFKS